MREVIQVAQRMRDEGLSVLLIEQNAPLSLAIADRAYVLDDGRLVYSGHAADLAKDIELVDKLDGAGKRRRGGRLKSDWAGVRTDGPVEAIASASLRIAISKAAIHGIRPSLQPLGSG